METKWKVSFLQFYLSQSAMNAMRFLSLFHLALQTLFFQVREELKHVHNFTKACFIRLSIKIENLRKHLMQKIQYKQAHYSYFTLVDYFPRQCSEAILLLIPKVSQLQVLVTRLNMTRQIFIFLSLITCTVVFFIELVSRKQILKCLMI